MTRSDLKKLMIRDLRKSGITSEYIEKLGVRPLMPAATEHFMTKGRGELFGIPSYEIPYFDSRGKRTGYSRLKNLSPLHTFRLKPADNKKKKTLKYLQRANTAPHLYIPNVIKWPRNEDGKVVVSRLVVTEGEKKATCACIRGIHCVALGGVDSFKSTKRSVSMLTEFYEFDLSETVVEICYDSDFNTNPDVQRASTKLAGELLSLNPKGLNIVYIDGETTDDGKMGLDDYLIQYEDEDAELAFDQLPRKEDDRFSRMNLLSADLCYLTRVGKLYNIPDDRYYDSAAQLIIDYGPKLRVTDPDNPHKQIPAVKLWLETRSDSTNCERTIYEPGKPLRYRADQDKRDSINVWRPSSVTPIEDDCSLWLQLVRYVMGSDRNANWFLQWLSFPLQHPGTKLLTAVFVYSHAQGVGKNFIIEPLVKALYGDNYQLITSETLHRPQNAWASKKQFIFGEEIYVSDKRDREAIMGKLKSLVSNDTVSVEEKYRPLETFKNCAQYYLTANQSNALALDSTDRRFFVIHAPETPLPEAFYEKLHAWCQKKTSAGKVLSHLLYKIDCSDFNPRAHALMTDAKRETMEHGQDIVTHWVVELVNEPEKFYTMNRTKTTQELFSAVDIHTTINLYLKENNLQELRITPNSIGRYLSATNKLPYKRVRLTGGSDRGVYAVFNREHWAQTKSRTVWGRHYREHDPASKKQDAVKSKLAGNPKGADILPFKKKTTKPKAEEPTPPPTKPRATL